MIKKTINPKFQEAKKCPSTRKMKRTTPRHIIIEQFKISHKDKKKNLKSNQKKKKDLLHKKNDNKLHIRNNVTQKTIQALSSI